MIGQSKVYTIPFGKLSPQEKEIIGVHADLIQIAVKSGVRYTPGFVLTTSAFDNFLVANDLVSELNELLTQIKPNDTKNINKTAEKIKELFRASVIPPSIFQSIISSYELIVGNTHSEVGIFTSWIEQTFPFSGNAYENYIYEGIGNVHDLEKTIIEAWCALFDPKAIIERMANNYQGPLSIALIIQKQTNPQISGRVSSYNPIGNNIKEVEIEAVYGLWKCVDELNTVPDRYVVAKQGEKIVEKSTVGQEKMILRNGSAKTQTFTDIKIPVSSPWKMRQKVSDSMIQDIALYIKTIEKQTQYSLEARWVIELGKIILVKIAPQLKMLGKNYEIYEEKQEIGSEDKSIEDYVKEIEKEIKDVANHIEAPLDINEFKTLAGEIELVNKTINIPEPEEEKQEVEPIKIKKSEIWKKFNFLPKKQVDPTVVNIWIDTQLPSSKYEMNSNEFYGITGVSGNDLFQNFNSKLQNLSAREWTEFVNYGTEELFYLANKDLNNYIIYDLSLFSREESNKYLDSDTFGLDVYAQYPQIIENELEILKKLRNNYGFRKIWLSIRGLDQIEDLRNIKKHITTSGLRRSTSFKLLLEIDSIPVFLNTLDYISESIDGIIVDFDKVIEKLLGNKVKQKELLANQVLWDLIAKIGEEVHKNNIEFIIKSSNIKSAKDLLFQLMKRGITGVASSARDFPELRTLISKLEIEILKKL